MAYDGFYGDLSTRASVSEVLNQALAAQEGIRSLAGTTLSELNAAAQAARAAEMNVQVIESNVQNLESNVGEAVGRAELSAIAANDYAGESLANAAQSQQALIEVLGIKNSLGDTSRKFDEIDSKFKDVDTRFDFFDARISPILQTDSSAMDESVAVLGGGVQAEFKDGITQPPVGIVSAYAARTLVKPKVDWNTGWTTGYSSAVIAEEGGKRISKIVTHYSQLDALHEGSDALLGYEFSLGGINPTGNFSASSDFFSPNLENVPNKHRIQRMAAFTNQDTGKIVQSYGPFVDKRFREVSPIDHPGYLPGRWYSNPYYSTSPGPSVPANNGWCKSFYFGTRVNLAKLRVYTGPGAGGSYKVGIYTAVGGKVANKEWASGLIASPGANTHFDVEVNTQIDAGSYYVVVACTVAGQTLGGTRLLEKLHDHMSRYGTTDTSVSNQTWGVAPLLPLPALSAMDAENLDAEPTFINNTENGLEPRVYFQIGVISPPSYPGNGRPLDN